MTINGSLQTIGTEQETFETKGCLPIRPFQSADPADAGSADLAAAFAARMARLGPFEPSPRLALAVSGGADSMALALLARHWAAERGGSALALVVDHGLRPESADEAALTLSRLTGAGIAARVLPLTGLAAGPALAERARAARYAALAAACAEAGIAHLLLGHHAGDQAETVLIRALAGSGPHGLAGMAALVEHPHVRLLRPLLDVAPGRLRALLRAAGWEWVEDPSNTNPMSTRVRLRALRHDRDGAGPATSALVAAARADGLRRAADEAAIAEEIASQVTLRPEGFALIPPSGLSPAAFGRLVAAIGGLERPLPERDAAALADRPRAATIAGTELVPAGRLGPGWLLVREAAAARPPVTLAAGAVWDGRFKIVAAGEPPAGDALSVGALGVEAARFRGCKGLPTMVLRSLPAVRAGGELLAVPHLDWPGAAEAACFRCVFAPPPAAGPAPFLSC
ncbi:MAG TPA: tRNA lysidine(34) synthetase TilS [Acetobacteraceae bacterium]|nr:tRNA lysidine(34) synthetase TilS [Acetobacteraceae bacterium]